MINFAHSGSKTYSDDSLEMVLLALGALAIGLVLGYVLGRNNPAKTPAKKSAKK